MTSYRIEAEMAPKKSSQGRRRRTVEVPECQPEEAAAWFAGRLPDGWFSQSVDVHVDLNEIIVSGTLPVPENMPDGDAAAAVAAQSRIEAFREETRGQRIQIAEVAQVKWVRHVTWQVSCGDREDRFTSAHVPVMTRLGFEDRQVLDTLIDAGVARSRSEAMAWCVNQVGQHQSEWIDRLREAMTEVERLRNEGP